MLPFANVRLRLYGKSGVSLNLCQKCRDAIRSVVSATTVAGEDILWGHEIVPESKCEFWAHRNLNLLNGVIRLEIERLDEHARAYQEMLGRGNLDARIAKTNACRHFHMDLAIDRCFDCGETREFQLWASRQVAKS